MKFRWKLAATLLTLALLITPAYALTAPQLGELLEDYYVDELPAKVLEQTTVEDMLAALGDPYTEYFDAETYLAFLDSMKDAFTYGIGITMQKTEQGVLITEVLPGLGAEKAGIQKGDYITAVDGQSVAELSLEAVRIAVTGEEGTTVKIAVLRGTSRRTFTVTRMKVVIPATATTLLEEHIGYISCTTFGPETQGHFEEGVEQYDSEADRWIVDLRGNGGGDVNAAVQAAGVFTGAGTLTYLRDNEGSYGGYSREEGGLTMDPVIVLTDEHTASSSEIFSSIIRDRQAGIVLGGRTFGKGVAQTMLDKDVVPDYFGDGSALKVTAYRFFSPEGATTDKVGVVPHLAVEPEHTAGVAMLLSGAAPKGDTKGMLRLNLRWRWYVDLERAMSEEFRADFEALLEAIPGSATLWMGTGGIDGWREVTPAELAEEQGLTGYKSRDFLDTEDSPYAAEISLLATYGMVLGDGKGSYQPQKILTRAELCALLAQSLRYTSSSTGTFADVSADAWYADEVEALHSVGLINGYSDGLFHPDEPIDHQQLMVILARAARRLGMSFYEAVPEDYDEMINHEVLAPFAKWAREDVWLLDGSQSNPMGGVSLLWESLTDIDPAAPATREEAACLLYNVLSFSGILPR